MLEHTLQERLGIDSLFFIHPPPFSLARSSLRIAGITLLNCTIYYLPGPTHPPTHLLRPTDLPTLRPYSWSPNDESLPFLPHVLLLLLLLRQRERERETVFLSLSAHSSIHFGLHFYTFIFILTLFFLVCADCWIVGFGNKNETSLEPLDDLFLLLLLFCSNNNAMCRSRRAQQ